MLLSSLRNPALSENKKYSRKLLFWLLGIILVLTVIHVALQYLNLEVYNEKNGPIFELSNRFDFDDEASIMTWLSQFQLLILSALCALAFYVEKFKVVKRLWLVLSAIAFAFSIDETATLHEFILQRIHVAFFQDAKPTLLSNSWVIVLPLILFIAVLLGRLMFKYLPRRTILLMSIGGVVFISGAVVVDLLTSGIPGSLFVTQGIFVAVEEASEMVGVAIATYAAASYLEQIHRHKISKTLKQLKG